MGKNRSNSCGSSKVEKTGGKRIGAVMNPTETIMLECRISCSGRWGTVTNVKVVDG